MSRDGSQFLTGILVGLCCSSAGFLATWPSVPPSHAPRVVERNIVEQKIVYAGLTILPTGGFRPIKKQFHDRIAATQTVTSQQKLAVEIPKMKPRIKKKVIAVAGPREKFASEISTPPKRADRCGSMKAHWYINSNGRRKYKCR